MILLAISAFCVACILGLFLVPILQGHPFQGRWWSRTLDALVACAFLSGTAGLLHVTFQFLKLLP